MVLPILFIPLFGSPDCLLFCAFGIATSFSFLLCEPIDENTVDLRRCCCLSCPTEGPLIRDHVSELVMQALLELDNLLGFY